MSGVIEEILSRVAAAIAAIIVCAIIVVVFSLLLFFLPVAILVGFFPVKAGN